MNRPRLFQLAFLFGASALLLSCKGESPNTSQPSGESSVKKSPKQYAVTRTDEEWRKQLTDIQYKVTRKKGTEQAFTGDSWDNHKEGVYQCVGCDQPLYKSATKFESGTGWPSFWEAASPEAVDTEEDRSWFSVRMELLCSRCGAHLGHAFDDGPVPTGMRHCINSAALKFVEKKSTAGTP